MIGAKFQAILGSISAPRDKDDNRTGSERRIDGSDQLITRILESGLPSDKGIRPHLSVIVDANTLDAGQRPPGRPMRNTGMSQHPPRNAPPHLVVPKSRQAVLPTQ